MPESCARNFSFQKKAFLLVPINGGAIYNVAPSVNYRHRYPKCLLPTYVFSYFKIFMSSIPMKGSLLLSSTFIVKLIAGCASFNVAKKAVAFRISFTAVKVSFAYLL